MIIINRNNDNFFLEFFQIPFFINFDTTKLIITTIIKFCLTNVISMYNIQKYEYDIVDKSDTNLLSEIKIVVHHLKSYHREVLCMVRITFAFMPNHR